MTIAREVTMPATFEQQVQLVLLDKLAIGIVVLVAAFVLNRLLERYKTLQAREKELALLQITTERAYVQRQLEELYSPLMALIQQSQEIYNIAASKLPSLSGRPPANKDEAEVWRWFVETYFLSINKQIGDIIRTKIYLLENGVLPESFTQFWRHETQYECLHRLWKDKQVSSDEIVGVGWPKTIQNDVETVLGRLRRRHESLAQQVSART
jgi:hypothetical protein